VPKETLCPTLLESIGTNRVLVVTIRGDGLAQRRSLSIPEMMAVVELSGVASELASPTVIGAGWLTDQHVGLLFDALPDDFGALLAHSAAGVASSHGLRPASLELLWTSVECSSAGSVAALLADANKALTLAGAPGPADSKWLDLPNACDRPSTSAPS
jgi:hypothetical protein